MLSEASNEIWGFAGPAVAEARNGRLATTLLRTAPYESLKITTGQDYELPPMAVGDCIDSVAWINEAGTQEWPLQVVPLGLEMDWNPPSAIGDPTHYALLDGTIRIYPRLGSIGTLRIVFQRRHGALVVGSDTAVVTGLADNGSGLSRITLTSTPASFVQGAYLDVIGATYPYRIKLGGAVINVSHGANQFTISVPLVDAISAGILGDTASIFGKTPYVHLPLEMRAALTGRVAAKIAKQLGDLQLAAMLEQTAELDLRRATTTLTPRTKSQREKAFNPRSLLRQRMRGWWR